MGMFSPANTKLKKLYKVRQLYKWLKNKRRIYSFDLLSGHSCPFAQQCFSKVIELGTTRKVVDGPKTDFRCYSASQEAIYTDVYNKRRHNFHTVRGLRAGQVYRLLESEKPNNMGICRIHTAGDFFNISYFNGWMKFVEANPDILFYAYTKALPYLVGFQTPVNMIWTASYGGKYDALIEDLKLRHAIVVESKPKAKELGLELDFDDSHAAIPAWRNKNFALHVHGVQPKGTIWAKSVQEMRSTKNPFALLGQKG